MTLSSSLNIAAYSTTSRGRTARVSVCPCSEGGCQRHRRSRGQENTTPHKSGHVVAESYFTPTGRGSERNQGAPQQRRRRSWHLALGHGRRARTRVSCTCKSVDRYSVQRARCLAIHGQITGDNATRCSRCSRLGHGALAIAEFEAPCTEPRGNVRRVLRARRA